MVAGESKSCGCFSAEMAKKTHYTGHEEISGAYFKQIQKGTASRNLVFNLKIEYLWKLFLKQKRKCALSGTILQFEPNQYEKSSRTASLDRINSNLGYIKGNVQWIHKNINFMKRKTAQPQFIEWCQKISKHTSQPKSWKTNSGIVYLACPYFHEDPQIVLSRFKQSNIAAGKLIKQKYIVFSPVSMSHPLSEAGKLPTNWEFWENFDRAFLGISSKLFVLKIPGWDTSISVKAEIEIAKELNLPVEYLEADFVK